MTEKKLSSLRAELMAIAVWDNKYERQANHSDVEKEAYRNRRSRRREIVSQIRRFVLDETQAATGQENEA